MPEFNFSVTNKVVSRANTNPCYVHGNTDYVVHVSFDEEWTEFVTKTARLRWMANASVAYRDIVFAGSSFELPALYGMEYIEVGFFAGNKHTTTPGVIRCEESILTGNPTEDEPDPDVYAQLLDLIQEGAVKGPPVMYTTDDVLPTVMQPYVLSIYDLHPTPSLDKLPSVGDIVLSTENGTLAKAIRVDGATVTVLYETSFMGPAGPAGASGIPSLFVMMDDSEGPEEGETGYEVDLESMSPSPTPTTISEGDIVLFPASGVFAKVSFVLITSWPPMYHRDDEVTEVDVDYLSGRGGGGGSDNVFWAMYNVTPFSDISQAYNAGQIVCVKYNDNIFTLVHIEVMSSVGAAIFVCPLGDGMDKIVLTFDAGDEEWKTPTSFVAQPQINDLSAIRAGAAAGATALQSEDIPASESVGAGLVWNGEAWVATDGEHNIYDKTIFDESIEFTAQGRGSYEGDFDLVFGNLYTVVYDGVTYENVECKRAIYLYLGSNGSDYSVYPFHITSLGVILNDDQAGTHTVSISMPAHRKIDLASIESNVQNGSGDHSVVIGALSTASGYAAVAESGALDASGSQAHAEGVNTIASGAISHAEGWEAIASGTTAHAENFLTKAEGNRSHAEGNNTIAGSDNQHVQGILNVKDSAGLYADIVGGGVDHGSTQTRKNIEATTWTGNKRLKGDVYVHCEDDSTGGEKLATENLIPTALSELSGDATHRLVTDAEKATWNRKQNVAPTIAVDASQIVSMEPLTIQLTDEQAAIFDGDNLNIFLGLRALGLMDMIMHYSVESSNGDKMYFTSQPDPSGVIINMMAYIVESKTVEVAYGLTGIYVPYYDVDNVSEDDLVKFDGLQLTAATPGEDYATPGTLTINETTYNLRTSTTDAGQAGYITFVTEE